MRPNLLKITDFNDLYVSFVSIAQAPHLTGNIDLNFQTGKYYEIGVPEATNSSTNYLSCTRASVGYAKNTVETLTYLSAMIRCESLIWDYWWKMRGQMLYLE